MDIFNFWKKKELSIDFSDLNIAELIKQTERLEQILIENGIGLYVEYLYKIRLAAENKNEVEFRKLVVSRELFGGAGALWEINIENSTEYRKFNKQFCEYIDLISKMGIRNGRVRQTRQIMSKLIRK